MVGKALAAKLAALGHQVTMGTRSVEKEAASAPAGINVRTFAEAAAFGETLISCTAGATSIDALRSVNRKDLTGKVLIDVSNPLVFTPGQLPTLSISNTDSLGETLQREFPELRVVKALNTCNCQVMVDPARVPGEHDLFIAGNDAAAKQQVTKLLHEFGWKSIIDLGDITGARATEQLMPFWLRVFGMYGSPDFNYRILKSPAIVRTT
jgi:predicted dinucleotide-binding enzyme